MQNQIYVLFLLFYLEIVEEEWEQEQKRSQW